MFDWFIKAAVVVFAVWIAWSVYRSRFTFMIRIVSGQPQLKKGTVTAAFLGRVAEACQAGSIETGWVGGQRRGKYMRLRFSRNFPPGIQQRLRNEWQAVG